MRIDEITKAHYRITPRMKQSARGNKWQVLVEMPAADFLELTTKDDEHLNQILQAAKPNYMYNRWAKAGDDDDYRKRINVGKTKDDEDYTWGSIIPPFLKIEIVKNFGKVVGHEGRHRAASILKKNKDGKIKVYLKINAPKEAIDHPKADIFNYEYFTRYEHMPKLIKNQINDNVVSTRNWEVIEHTFDDFYNKN